MEITRGTLVLVNGSEIGLVIKPINAPGGKFWEIKFACPENVLGINGLIALWQIVPEDIDKDIDYILGKYLPLIVIDYANKIANFEKALANLRLP